MHSDASPEVERMVLELRRKQTPSERLQYTFELTEMVRSFEVGVLKSQYPEAGEDELRFRLCEKRYGIELARKVFGRETATA